MRARWALPVVAARRLVVLLPLVLGCAVPPLRPAWRRPPPPTSDTAVIRPESLVRGELPNGLRTLVLEDRRLPRVVLGLTVRRGAAMVDPERAGLARFTVELMERGAGSRDAVALAEAVDEIGASLSAWAGWDAAGVVVSGLSRDLDRLVEILADVVLRPRFDPAEAERARGEQLASLEQAKDSSATLVRWYTARTLYAGHRFGLPRAGTPESVRRLDARAARGFHRQVFLPNNAVLFGSGDLSAADWASRAQVFFGAWKMRGLPDTGPAPPAPTPAERRVVIVDRPDRVQAQISIAHGGIPRTDPDRIAVGLMNNVIGGSGFSSRLTQRVRASSGLTYHVDSSFSMRRQPGPFAVSTSTRVDEARRVVDLVLTELERARALPPSAAELEDARALMIGRFVLGLETSAAVMETLVDLDVYGLPEDSLDTYRARIRATGADAVERMVRERLHPGRAAIVLVGPADRLVPQFRDLGALVVLKP